MPDSTTHYGLTKPRPGEAYNVEQFNTNADKLDAALFKKAEPAPDGKLPKDIMPDLDYIPLTDKGKASGVASLGPDGKVPKAQVPGLDYIPSADKGKPGGAASLDGTGKIPGAQLPGFDYVPNSEKGQASGVATLGANGKVPPAQLPTLDYIPTADKAVAGGVASLDGTGKVPSAQLPSLDYVPTSEKGAPAGVATLGADGKVPATQLPKLGTSAVDTTYDNSGSGLAATNVQEALDELNVKSSPSLTVYVVSGSAVTATCGANRLTGNSVGGACTLTLPVNGTWSVSATLNGATSSTASVAVTGVSAYTCSLAYASVTVSTTPATSGVAVTATCNGTTKHGTTNSSGQCVFSPLNAGTWNISGSSSGVQATASVYVAAGANGSATLTFIDPVFSNNSWGQIAKATELNVVPSTWHIGDTKNIVLSTNETLTLQIYDKKHDDLASGGKAGLTIGLKNLMSANQQMNSSNTNVGGFTGSALYTWLQNTLFGQLPSDLRAAIKSVNKKTSAGSGSGTINTNSMKIFLFSEVECFGTTTYSVAGEGSQYPIFTDNTSRIKYQSNGSGGAYNWWERSPYASISGYFCYVDSYGSANLNGANYAIGVCFGFCV